MVRILISIFILLFIIAGVVYFILQRSNYFGNQITKTSGSQNAAREVNKFLKITMKITSPVFEHNSNIPAKYTCDGENINPTLRIEGAPDNAKSLVLIVDDPDATRGWTWTHWTVWNIAPDTKEISENSVPEGAVEGKTDFGKPGWGGPCPPHGTGNHRYFFKLFALDTILDLAAGASLDELQKAMEGRILTQAELIGLYGRQ